VPNVARVAISPDHTKAVGIQHDQTNALTVIDLSSGATTQLQSEAGADQVAWSADGSTILYSTLTNPRQTQGTGNNPAGTQLFGSCPIDTVTNTVTLWRVPVSGGQSTQLFQRDGYAIGIIAPAPDNSGVLASFVNSSAAMITAVNNNTNIDQIRIAAPA